MTAIKALGKELTWFGTTAPGLEPVLKSELKQKGIEGNTVVGGIEFTANMSKGLWLCQHLRCASRLWLRLSKGRCHKVSQIGDLIRNANLGNLLKLKTPIHIQVSVSKSRLHRRDIVTQKAQRVCKGELKGEDTAIQEQTLLLRITDDFAVLSIDVGGRLLHKRGWRIAQGKASLRETWAANLLEMAGWETDEPILDPFCGSGTIPIEAARMAKGISPHVDLQFAHLDWKLQEQPIQKASQVNQTKAIWGFDHHGPSLVKAYDNAQKANVDIHLQLIDIADAHAPAPTGLMVCNPPYGRRLGQKVGGLYRLWGQTIDKHFHSWRGIFLCPNDNLAKHVHPRVEKLTQFDNGGISVGVWIWEART